VPPPEIQVTPPPQPQAAIQQVVHTNTPTPVAPHPQPAAPQAVPDHDVSERPIAGAPLEYPQQMLDEEREGFARISCDVDTNGSTSNCRVDAVSGGQAFASAALAYVKRARYAPRTHNGQPIASTHEWKITFKLNN